MNILGIIAEYNPMHNGHIYHINKAKELAKADYIAIIMSGSFTEQGNISVIDKFKKAEIAVQNGADLVIELPTIYATSSAEQFAMGAVRILNDLGITHLAFGAECNNIQTLKHIANICYLQNNIIIEKTKELMKTGISNMVARDTVLSEFLSSEELEQFRKPNNILAIQYLMALNALKSHIEPVLVTRCEISHTSELIASTSKYASSTAIRTVLSDKELSSEYKLDKLRNFIPENTLQCLSETKYKTNEDMWENLKYAILHLGKEDLKNIADVTEGLENRLYNMALTSNSYLEYIFKVKSKRYPLSRVKRVCVNILLNISKKLKEDLGNVKYARVLKISSSAKQLLSVISTNNSIPVICKLTDDTLASYIKPIQDSLKLDILATNIVTCDTKTSDYTNNIMC